MKNGMIFPFKKTWRSRLDLEYLDETSERKLSLRSSDKITVEKSRIGEHLRQFNDYASKELIGQVHAGGFLHHRILENPDGTRTAPSQLSNPERKQRISNAWFRHIRKFSTTSKNPVIQHRLVFTMSRQMHDKLVETGINPDRILHSTMKRIMGKFEERFHPADAIGYAYGIHHDTDNLHVHVALCPRSAKGAYVGCSMSRTATSGHKDQMKYLRSCFALENERWSEILASPQNLDQQLRSRLDSDTIIFSQKLKHFQTDALCSTQTGEAIRLQQLYQSIRNLEASVAAKRQYFVTKRRMDVMSRLLDHHRPKVARIFGRISDATDRRSLRELQNLLFKIKRDYRAAHKRYSQIHGFSSYANRITIQHSHRQQNSL